MDGYRKLANAIVKIAARDYCAALVKLYRNPQNHAAMARKNELESFFRSDWYVHLTDVDGEQLIIMLQSKARHTVKRKKKKEVA